MRASRLIASLSGGVFAIKFKSCSPIKTNRTVLHGTPRVNIASGSPPNQRSNPSCHRRSCRSGPLSLWVNVTTPSTTIARRRAKIVANSKQCLAVKWHARGRAENAFITFQIAPFCLLRKCAFENRSSNGQRYAGGRANATGSNGVSRTCHLGLVSRCKIPPPRSASSSFQAAPAAFPVMDRNVPLFYDRRLTAEIVCHFRPRCT